MQGRAWKRIGNPVRRDGNLHFTPQSSPQGTDVNCPEDPGKEDRIPMLIAGQRPHPRKRGAPARGIPWMGVVRCASPPVMLHHMFAGIVVVGVEIRGLKVGDQQRDGKRHGAGSGHRCDSTRATDSNQLLFESSTASSALAARFTRIVGCAALPNAYGPYSCRSRVRRLNPRLPRLPAARPCCRFTGFLATLHVS